MDYKEIESLLEKYFEGQSSVAEEQQLKRFFETHSDLPPELESAAQMLRHFKSESQVKMNKPVMRISQNQNRNRLWWLSGIAASVFVVLSAIFWVTPGENPAYVYINGQPITEQEVALGEMKKALTIMTSHLNQGTEGLSQLSKLDQIKKSISK